MRFLTLSTTGIFNAIRPSLFPPIEGKETTTFLLALEYNYPIIPFLEDDTEEVKAAREDLSLERQRIRAFVKALCNDFGKPIEELQTEVISCLPEFIKHGTYDGEALLSKPRKGSYRVYSMYKSYRGRKMLFQKHRSPKDEAQYIHDHMLRYFLNRFFSTDGLCGCMTGVDHIDTPLSVTTVQQILEDVEHASMPETVSISSIPNTYTMNEPTLINSEFLLIADALGAYMVQGMEGETESEQLANLTKDTFFSDICESLYKHFIFISDCSKIAVYDEWNIWVDKLLDIYSRNQYSQLQRLLQDEVPSYNDGVIGYVKDYHIGPLLDRLVNDLTRDRLKISLYPKPDQRQSYLDFIIDYGSSIQSIVEGICKQGGDGSDIYKYQDLATVLTLDSRLCCTFYCMIDACCVALNKYMYAAIIPIVDKLDEKLVKVQISTTDTWQVEYVVKLSRISQWYRALAYAFTRNENADTIFKDLMDMQEKDPVRHSQYLDPILMGGENPEHAFSIDSLRYVLLNYYVETKNRLGYERYIKEMYPSVFDLDFDYYAQMHALLDLSEDGVHANYSNKDFYLWLKALYTFHLDHIDKDFWNEMASLWEKPDKISYLFGVDYYALCTKYMVKLAIRFGDTGRAERYKREIAAAITEVGCEIDDAPSDYKWPLFEYYIMAQINETLGHLDLAKEEYHKAYNLAMFSKACWQHYEEDNGGIWKSDEDSNFGIPELKLKDWLKENTVTYDTIEEYKQNMSKYMTYIFD